MSKLALYQYNPRQIIIPDSKEAYFARDFEVYNINKENYHNPEWYIQHKILANKDGYFDFSKNMIDIGACYGWYTWALPFKHSYMFEPNKEYFAYINANALLHERIDSVTMFNVAVTDYDGTIQFDGFNSGELAHPGGNAWTQTVCINVPCMKLDSHAELFENIGFIKIDIETMEAWALSGMEEVIRNNNYPPILFENWGAPDPEHQYDTEGTHETVDHYERRMKLLTKVLIDDLGYQILWGWGDNLNHLAVHR